MGYKAAVTNQGALVSTTTSSSQDSPSDQEYRQIQEQIAQLQARAKQIEDTVRAQEIKAIKEKIELFKLIPSELFSSAVLYSRKSEKIKRERMSEKIGQATDAKKEPPEVKYRGPNGETWGGGRGRKPAWIQALLDAGESLEKYRV